MSQVTDYILLPEGLDLQRERCGYEGIASERDSERVERVWG